MEANTVPEMKDPGKGIGLLPACSEPRLQIVVLIFFDQRVKNECSNSLRLGVGADAKIEVVGTALDHHDERVLIGTAVGVAAGDEYQTGQDTKAG